MGPQHWRGDREGDEVSSFEAFNVAFPGLVGRDEGELTSAQMTAFREYALALRYPPNPIRKLDNTLRDPSGGEPNELRGSLLYGSAAAPGPVSVSHAQTGSGGVGEMKIQSGKCVLTAQDVDRAVAFWRDVTGLAGRLHTPPWTGSSTSLRHSSGPASSCISTRQRGQRTRGRVPPTGRPQARVACTSRRTTTRGWPVRSSQRSGCTRSYSSKSSSRRRQSAVRCGWRGAHPTGSVTAGPSSVVRGARSAAASASATERGGMRR